MNISLLSQRDYISFILGFVLLVSAVMVWELTSRSATRLKWRWVMGFSLLFAFSIWLDMTAIGLGDTPAFHLVRVLLRILAGLSLLEFARLGIKAQRGKTPRLWVYLPFLAVTAVASLGGLDTLDAVSRYAFALPGGLISAWVVQNEIDASNKPPMRLTLWIVIGLVLLALLSGPRAEFFPASLINYELFFQESGEPIAALYFLLLLIGMIIISFIAYMGRKASGGITWFQRWLIPALIAGFLFIGWWLVNSRSEKIDLDTREKLLADAAAIASTIKPDSVHQLTFSSADIGNPNYERLRAQLMAYAQASGYRSIYTLVVREDKMLFGPESLPADDVWASPPGTVYFNATPEDWKIFENGIDFTEGPTTDEYGTFISALASVIDPLTGKVLMAVGIDMEQTAWRALLARERLLVILFILLNVNLLLVADVLLFYRSQLRSERFSKLRYIEAFLVFIAGLIYSAVGGVIAAENQKQIQLSKFRQLSDSQATLINDTLSDICNERMQNLESFFVNSEYVSLQEFVNFTQSFLRDGIVQAWEWIPYVPKEEKSALEADALQQGIEGFSIYELDEQGNQVAVGDRPAYYPVYYVSPLEKNRAAIGLDLGFDEVWLSALEEASQTGLPTFSLSDSLVQVHDSQVSVFLVNPVFSGSVDQSALKGYTAAVLRMQHLIDHTLLQSHLSNEQIAIGIYKLRAGDDALLLASSSTDEDHLEIARHTVLHQSPAFTNLYPLFMAGKAFVMVTHPGEQFWLENRSNNILASVMVGLVLTLISSAFTGMLSQYQSDLKSQVKERTSELKRSEEKFAKAFHASGVLMAVTDVGFGRYVDVNQAFCETLGFTPEEVIGKTSSELALLFEPVLDEDIFQEVREKGSFRDAEVQVRTRAGVIVYGLLSMDAITLDSKPHLLISMLDITERKRSEEALRSSQKYADLGTLAAGVAHELNTPLQIITGSADSLLRGVASPETVQPERLKRYLENISRSAWRMSDIVRTLNIYARHNREDEDEYDLNELVRDTLVLMENQLRVWSNVQVILMLKEDLPFLKCNRNDITQILINLISNARDAMPVGGKIGLATSYDAEKEELILEVSDTGPGVPPEIREKIFNPFFTTKPVGKGTGLGLSIVLGIAQHYQAQITVHEAPEGGAVFRLHFPIQLKSSDEKRLADDHSNGRYF